MLRQKNYLFTKFALFSAIALALPLAAQANGDPMVEGARLCTQYFPQEEQKNGIPTHLLAAISSTESGRWHNGLGLALPWPWTINVEGKGYYFNSKAEAMAQVAALQKRGVRSIDVGCMQVSLLHHPHAFSSLDQAFDPATNVAYGAKFLRENYDDLHDWVKATAAYHSRTPVYGRQYLGQIEKSWNRIVSKIQEARAQQGLQPSAVATPQFSSTALPPAPASGRAVSVASAATASGAKVLHPITTANASGLQKLHSLRDTHGVHVIEVSDAQTRRSSDTMVVQNGSAQVAVSNDQAAATTAPAANYVPAVIKLADARDSMAQATQASEVLVRGGSDSVRQVHLDAGLNSSQTTINTTDSRFVFAN